MRVERSSLDQVKKRFEVNKKKLEEKQKEYDFEERMKELREEVSSHFPKLDPGDSQSEDTCSPQMFCRFNFNGSNCSITCVLSFLSLVRRRRRRPTRRRSRRRGSAGRKTTWTSKRMTRWLRWWVSQGSARPRRVTDDDLTAGQETGFCSMWIFRPEPDSKLRMEDSCCRLRSSLHSLDVLFIVLDLKFYLQADSYFGSYLHHCEFWSLLIQKLPVRGKKDVRTETNDGRTQTRDQKTKLQKFPLSW